MELDTVSKVKQAFYRLTGVTSSDAALTEQGESTDDVAYIFLTSGCRQAQRWMLDMGYGGWRKRSPALSWSGADSTDGGRYASLPSDFLKAYGNKRVSCLVEPNGDRWGLEISRDEEFLQGDYFYFRGDELWLARTAQPPSTVYLDYHYQHPLWNASVTIDFPMEARPLIVAEAANEAKEENWFPLDASAEVKIERYLMRSRDKARRIARRSKSPRQFLGARRYGNRW